MEVSEGFLMFFEVSKPQLELFSLVLSSEGSFAFISYNFSFSFLLKPLIAQIYLLFLANQQATRKFSL